MSNTLLAWQNYVASGTLSSASAAMPLSNLQDDSGSPAVAWQTAAGVTSDTLRVTFAATASLVNAIGLFRTNLTAAATVYAKLTTVGVGVVWTTGTVSPFAGYGQTLALLGTAVSADYVDIHISDPTNPDGFLNVPLAFVGPAWFPATGAGWQSTFGWDDQVDETVSRGGQEYPVLRWQRRHYALSLDGIRSTELFADLDALSMSARAGGNILFVPDQTSSTLQREAVFGRLKTTADVSFPYQAADRRAWRATISERI